MLNRYGLNDKWQHGEYDSYYPGMNRDYFYESDIDMRNFMKDHRCKNFRCSCNCHKDKCDKDNHCKDKHHSDICKKCYKKVLRKLSRKIGISGLNVQLVNNSHGVIANGRNVIFDTIKNNESSGISYNETTGEFILNEPGNYLVSWWVSIDGAGSSTYVEFTLRTSNGVSIPSDSPITTGQVNGSGLITVGRMPVAISLINTTGQDANYGLTPVQGNLVITKVTI